MRHASKFAVLLFGGLLAQAPAWPSTLFFAMLDRAEESRRPGILAEGLGVLLLGESEEMATLWLHFHRLSGEQTGAEIHGTAAGREGKRTPRELPLGRLRGFGIPVDGLFVSHLRAGLLYLNVRSAAFPSGEIRSRLRSSDWIDRRALADLIQGVREDVSGGEEGRTPAPPAAMDAVPEPAGALLLASGLAGLAALRRRSGSQ